MRRVRTLRLHVGWDDADTLRTVRHEVLTRTRACLAVRVPKRVAGELPVDTTGILPRPLDYRRTHDRRDA
jgi:hypothetical protein